MTSRSPLIRGLLPAVCALALGTAGCATAPPPTVQMTVARASVEAANAAGAQLYAPGELRVANEKIASAAKAMADKDYRVALQFAEQAQVDAQLALGKTQSAKARQAANDAQADGRAVHEELQRTAPRTSPGGTQ